MVASLPKMLCLPSSTTVLHPEVPVFINIVSQASDIPAVFQRSGPDRDFEVGVGAQIWKQWRSCLPVPNRFVEGTLRVGPKQSDIQKPTLTTLPPTGQVHVQQHDWRLTPTFCPLTFSISTYLIFLGFGGFWREGQSQEWTGQATSSGDREPADTDV